MPIQEPDIAIGAAVAIVGVVVGRSTFAEGPPSYLVEFDQRGKPQRQWFLSADIIEEDDTDGE
jgi:hypothetical protein